MRRAPWLALALLLGACRPESPAPPGGPSTGRDPTEVALTASVLSVGEASIEVLGPQGVLRLVPRQGSAAAFLADVPHAPGTTLSFTTLASTAEERTVVGVRVHTGLPIAYGRVVGLDTRAIVLESPLGRRTFARNRWSDVPAEVEVGRWVGLKHYGVPRPGDPDGDQRTVLNVMPLPGEIVERGVVLRVEAGPPRVAVLATIKGERTIELPAAEVAAGSAVEIRRAPSAPPEDTVVTAITPPFPFIGKLVEREAPDRVRMVDAWGQVLGQVVLALASPAVFADTIVPGDLVELAYRIPPEGLSVAVEARERELSPVYFGRILRLRLPGPDSRGELELVTLQRQHKVLDLTADTFVPVPIREGDDADVGYERGSVPETARFVVKE